MTNQNRVRMLVVAGIWIVVISIFGLVLKWWYFPKVEKEEALAKQEEKKQVLASTGSDARYKYQVNFGLDSFSGYALFRSPEFQNECAKSGIKINLVDDKADYNLRLQNLKSGELQMATFTIDALIASSVNLRELPATIIAVVDETKGADAMVGYSPDAPNLDVLNDPETRFVITANSPSETLARVVMAHFSLDRLAADPWVRVNGASEVYEHYRKSKPGDKMIFCLWEPFVSKITDNPDYRVLVDSSKFKGYLVDVLVVSRDFLLKNEALVDQITQAYFRTNYHYKDQLSELVLEDARLCGEPLKPEQAQKLVSGIQWRNTQENYAYFGLRNEVGYQHLEDVIRNITGVLMKTGAIPQDPTNGSPNLLYYDKVLRRLQEQNFHPGSEEIQQEKGLRELAEEDWKELVSVGTLMVPPLVYGRGTARLTVASETTLEDLAKSLQTWPQYYLRVVANSSPDGDVEANRLLAQERANSAIEWLSRNGVSRSRMKAETTPAVGSKVSFVLGQSAY